jgi:methylated-DNA-protein-cysteine methyltransferase related protein
VAEYARIYAIVSRIPKGKVASYGQIAEAAGLGRGSARQIGYALHALKDDRVPWHRVINSKGEISHPEADYQRDRLEAEGVHFDARNRAGAKSFVATSYLARAKPSKKRAVKKSSAKRTPAKKRRLTRR